MDKRTQKVYDNKKTHTDEIKCGNNSDEFAQQILRVENQKNQTKDWEEKDVAGGFDLWVR